MIPIYRFRHDSASANDGPVLGVVDDIVPAFTKPALNITASAAMAKALTLEREQALILLQNTATKLQGMFTLFSTHCANASLMPINGMDALSLQCSTSYQTAQSVASPCVISREEFELIVNDVTAAINDLKTGNGAIFHSTASCLSAQSAGVFCAASERVTSLDEYR